MVSVTKAGSDWRQIGLLNLLLVASLSRGEIYETQQMEQIEEYRSEDVERCVRSHCSEAVLKVALVVKSTAVNIEYDAGFSQETIASVDSWHKLSIKHVTPGYKHNLQVKVDNKTVDFNLTGKGMWFSTSYSYEKIILSAKGKVEVVECNVLATAGKPIICLPPPSPSAAASIVPLAAAAPTVPLTAAPTVPPTTAAPTVPPTAAPTVPPTTAAPTVPPTAAPPHPTTTAAPPPPTSTAITPEPYHPPTNKDKVTTAGVGGSIPEQPMHQPPNPTAELPRPPAPTKEDAEASWMWSMGGVPVVPLTIVAVVVLAVSITLCVVWGRKRSQAKHKATKAARLESIRHTDYQVVDTRDEMEGYKEGPRKDEGVVKDARLNQTMDDSYEPVMNHGGPLTTFSNSGIENRQH
ncbi:formin-like protein [Penaeus chinensis]|uniref:formin-like protein n=1 Tax=Penaeus chinensis TaxID=139456 RepID=UPI001FB7D299|nr:formin-like protein [Penaeus chinensis]